MGWQQNMATMAKEQQAGAAASIGPGAGQKKRKHETSPQIETGQVCSKTGQFFLPRRLVLKYGSKTGMFLVLESLRRGHLQLI